MSRNVLFYFRAEAREILQELSEALLGFEKSREADLLTRILRQAHTLKGAARVAKQNSIAEHIHRFEDLFNPYRETPSDCSGDDINSGFQLLDAISATLEALDRDAETSSAVPSPSETRSPDPLRDVANGQVAFVPAPGKNTAELDALLDDLHEAGGQLESLRKNLDTVERGKTLGELLLAQLAVEGAPKAARLVAEELQTLLKGMERSFSFGVDQVARELRQVQESAEKLRLVRADTLFPALRRALRDGAAELGVSADLLAEAGGDLRLEGDLLVSVQGALIQMIRNCVAHGIESERERLAAGKPARATVCLQIERQGGELVFRCRDDGRGVNLEAVRNALTRRGVDAGQMDKSALLEALLSGGISTATRVTQAAGRGVGLDVIRQTAQELGGSIRFETELGLFTQITMRLPWSVAGMDFLEVGTMRRGGSVLIPLHRVSCVLRLNPEDISREPHGQTVLHEGKGLRLLSLSALLGHVDLGERTAVVVSGVSGAVALSAYSARGTKLANLLPLPKFARSAAYVAGAVLDADGNAQLVIDVEALVDNTGPVAQVLSAAEESYAPLLVIDDSLTTRMLQQSILESAGFEVDLASSAEEGLEKVRTRPYGLILVDVEMPGIDGFTFIERIRSDPSLAHIPAILVTSRDAPEDKLRGQAVGAQGYMVKSEFDQKYLLQQIRSLLR